ncbi:MAG: hypothetical protein U1E77_17095 [Inhella sp.]
MAHPEPALAVFQQAEDGAAAECGHLGRLHQLEADAVEACQAAAGAHPERAVARLVQGLHRAHRQALLGLPAVDAVLAEHGVAELGRQRACRAVQQGQAEQQGDEEEQAHRG